MSNHNSNPKFLFDKTEYDDAPKPVKNTLWPIHPEEKPAAKHFDEAFIDPPTVDALKQATESAGVQHVQWQKASR
jgi:hypothetical protein